MKRIFKFLISNKFLIALTLLINIGIYILFYQFVGRFIYEAMLVFAALIVLIIVNKSGDSIIFKILWLLLMLSFPFLGMIVYSNARVKKAAKNRKKQWANITYNNSKFLEQNTEFIESANKSDKALANINNYITNFANMPVYQNSQSLYIPSGEEYFKDLFASLNSAKQYILLEYFTIKPGKVWDELFAILRKKALEGVEIKVIYDDFGCIRGFSDKKYFKKLANHKIDAVPFNKVDAGLHFFANYRNHRKIAIIDGKTSFIGGVNIGDEYANIDKNNEYWKDTAIKIIGPAVWNNVVMFFNVWGMSTGNQADLSKYVPNYTEVIPTKNKEFVQPYGTGPLSAEPVARNIYLKIINTAKNYLYITTPYFIIDQHMQESLKMAAQGGVEVKIIMPSTPEKKWAFYLSRSYYETLIKAGVKIYEYTPGFMGAKMMIADGDISIVGTANFEFRSLYLHFENGVILSNSKTNTNIKYDFDSIINSSRLLNLRDIRNRKWHEKVIGQLLRVFAPLI